jgi:hypothetical protein
MLVEEIVKIIPDGSITTSWTSESGETWTVKFTGFVKRRTDGSVKWEEEDDD